MKLRLILFIAVVLSTFVLPAAVYGCKDVVDTRVQAPETLTIESGTPSLWKTLSGKVVVVNVYIDTPTSRWTNEELVIRKQKVAEALRWLSQEAKANNVSLQFTGINQRSAIPKFSIDQTTWYIDHTTGWFTAVLRKLKVKHQRQLIDAYKKKYKADSVAIILHVNEVFTSHTTFLPSVSIISSRQPPQFKEDYPTRAATIAHELLHQYGVGHTKGPEREIMAPGAGKENINENFIGVESGAQMGWNVTNDVAVDEYIHFLASHGAYDAALDLAQKALANNPNYKKGHYWYDLGNIQYLRKEYADAIDAYDKALGEDPDNQDTINAREAVRVLMQAQ